MATAQTGCRFIKSGKETDSLSGLEPVSYFSLTVVARAVVVSMLALAALPVQAEWFQEGQNKMGTRVFVKFWHEDATTAGRLLLDTMAEFERIEQLMSTYRANSEISRINNNASDGWVRASEELFGLISRSIDLSIRTNGAFDITYDSVGQLYNFNKQVRPSSDQLQEKLPTIDYRHLQLDTAASSIRFSDLGVRINLGGIAKGYAVEAAIVLLKASGVRHAIVNAGGDTRVLGDRLGEPWVIGIRDPDNEMGFLTRIELDDSAMSTSGDYERFFIEDGIRYHHIIDPGTGRPTSGLRGVTVIGPDTTMTDGLSTSVFVLGGSKGIELIENLPGYDALLIDYSGKVYMTAGIEPL